MRNRQCVRVVLYEAQTRGNEIAALLECFRYAGVIGKPWDSDGNTFFDIPCPKGLNDRSWADANARRMQSFGFNAVSAPAQFAD